MIEQSFFLAGAIADNALVWRGSDATGDVAFQLIDNELLLLEH
jgi:hypothetical protein